jgi:isoquinoline 1-oxidoreductase beta subunit
MKKTNATQLDRRSFIKVSAMAGGGIMIGLYVPESIAQQGRGGAPAATPVAPSTYIRVNPNNTFNIVGKNPETGQGIKNALPMIIADEFDVDWKQVTVDNADFDPKYGRDAGAPTLRQIEGGSTAIPQNYTPMRNVGAAARMMMIATAAQTWNVPQDQLTTGSGAVTHAASKRTATYASLAEKAMSMPPMELTAIRLKDPKDFKIMGKPLPGVDNFSIVTGKPLFSIDIEPANMLHAVFEKCPVFGGKAVSANLDDIKKLPGIKHAFIVDAPAPPAAGARGGGAGGGPAVNWASGVAIVADNWWLAQNARKSLKVVWDEGPVATQSSAGYAAQAKQLSANASQPPAGGGPGGANIGDVDAAFKTAAKVVEAEYIFPLLSHAPLEPQDSTAHFKDGKLEIWSPSQIPGLGGPAAAAGITQADVTMHLVRAGGGFGRRLVSEYDIEVAKIARVVADERAKAGLPSVPVKLVWSREDDMQHDNYRPGGFHYFKAALDANGRMTAFRDFVATVTQTPVPANEFPRGHVANFRVSGSPITPFNIPTGALRAPGTNGTSFVMQSFIDEVAAAAGKDPLQFQLDLLNNPVAEGGAAPGGFNASRARGVLEAVRDMSDWNNRGKLPKGTAKGVAMQYAHAGYVAYVVQVTIGSDKRLKVDKAWAAIDIGRQIVNTSMSTNLVEGGFIEGMSHLMAWEITLDKGRVVQTNFGQYQPTRMSQVPPAIEVKFLQTDFNPTGLGEPSLPPAPPAICNAIFAATGVRIRSLPIASQGYRWT